MAIPNTEKNRSGPQMSKLPPSVTLIWPSAQTIFLSAQRQSPDLCRRPTHYPDEAKLFMHERRIESSLNRTITKLKRLQIVRRIEREDAEPAFGGKFEIRSSKFETSGAYTVNFAEQTQTSAFDGKLEVRNERGLRREFRGTKPICAGLNGLNVFYGKAL